MQRVSIVMTGLALFVIGCDRTVAPDRHVAISESQRIFESMIRASLSAADTGQAASNGKAIEAAVLQLLDQYKALTDERKQAVRWVGRGLAPGAYSTEKTQVGLLLADPAEGADNRIIYALTDVESRQHPPSEPVSFDGNIAHIRIEFLVQMQGRFYETSLSTRGEVWLDATGRNPLRLAKARVIVELVQARVSPYHQTPSPAATKP